MQKAILNDLDSRTKLLIGEENFLKLSNKKVAVCGLGGVGSIIPISLVRSGISNMVIVDYDTVDISNLNRQIAYDLNDVFKTKTDALEEKILLIRKEANIKKINAKIDSLFKFEVLNDCDYVFDCIDDLDAKVLLLKYCTCHNINVISSLGMGNRINSCKVAITKLNKTTGDPLARKLRYLLKIADVDISKIIVSFSNEEPIIRGRIISSMVFTPNASGLAMASFALEEMLKQL